MGSADTAGLSTLGLFHRVIGLAALLLHLIPGVIETSIRLPLGHPFAESPESPALRPILLGLITAWIIGLVLQLRWLRGQGSVAAVPATAR